MAEECTRCHNKLTVDKSWEPATGYNPRLRKFICEKGHEEFLQLAPSTIEQLKGQKENATCKGCGQVKYNEVWLSHGQRLCKECRARKGG